jgi:hypothetical protein
VEYWQKIKILASYEGLPEAFEDPDKVILELKERAEQIQGLNTTL